MRIFKDNPKAALEREKIQVEREKVQTELEKVQMQHNLVAAQNQMLQKFVNSGYDGSGASYVKKSLKGWTANSRTAREDFDPHASTLRQRCRDLYMSSPLAVSAIKTKKTNAVGSGLKLKSRIDYEFLGISQERAAKTEAKIEREFDLWAKSKHSDALKLNNFYEQQQLAFGSWKTNGDSFGIIKYDMPTPYMPYGLRIHLIEADRVTTPDSSADNGIAPFSGMGSIVAQNLKTGNYIYNGVEVDSSGAVVAYWVCNQYLNSNLQSSELQRKWTRIEAFGKQTGNPNIIQLFDSERCEQYRGVPMLAPVIECLKQITRYTEAELMAAVVQSFYTVFIKTEADTSQNPMNPIISQAMQVENDDVSYELGSGAVNVLKPGESIELADPKRPNSAFEMFVASMAKMIGAALDVPYEVLMKSFTSSYSASRAALLEAWKSIKIDRELFTNDFCKPIYEIWLSEAVALGRVNLPGFFNDPIIKAAWCRAEWVGPTQGQIEPVKEVQAAIMRVENCFSTREQETTALTGGDFDMNVSQAKLEQQKMIDAGLKEDPKQQNRGKGVGNE